MCHSQSEPTRRKRREQRETSEAINVPETETGVGTIAKGAEGADTVVPAAITHSQQARVEEETFV